MESSSNVGAVSALKTRADELQAEARVAGSPIKRAQALELVAREKGFKDWNAAVAAAKIGVTPVAAQPLPSWMDIDSPLPLQPFRIHLAGDRAYESVSELFRWAKQLDLIGGNIPEEARREMLDVIGGRVPYVFVRDVGRWSDALYHLCDRGYEAIKGVVATREQLAEAGVLAWHDHCGTHSGDDMISVVHDDVRKSRDAVVIKRMARVVANIALLADRLQAERNEDHRNAEDASSSTAGELL